MDPIKIIVTLAVGLIAVALVLWGTLPDPAQILPPDWRHAPAAAQWLAQDADGTWHWFRDEPKVNETYAWWEPVDITVQHGIWYAGRTKVLTPWRASLEHRFVGVPQ